MKLVCIAFSLLFIALPAHADASAESLSPELRNLLSKEMQALEEGMNAIGPAYVSGNLEEVARIAAIMKDSYILKQQITSEQKKELMSKMPDNFLQLDQQFHEFAGMLEHVAEEKHMELVGFYYYKLTESCVGCHSQFASHRFPEFKSGGSDEGHHH